MSTPLPQMVSWGYMWQSHPSLNDSLLLVASYFSFKLIPNWWAWERCLRDGVAEIWALSSVCSYLWQPQPPGTVALTESVEILTTIYTYCHQQKGGRWGSKNTQQARMAVKGKLARSHTVGKQSTPALQNHIYMRPHGHQAWSPWETADQHWLTQTLPKLHLHVAPYKTFGFWPPLPLLGISIGLLGVHWMFSGTA